MTRPFPCEVTDSPESVVTVLAVSGSDTVADTVAQMGSDTVAQMANARGVVECRNGHYVGYGWWMWIAGECI